MQFTARGSTLRIRMSSYNNYIGPSLAGLSQGTNFAA